MPSLARSVPKPLKVPSLARSVHKPLKVPCLARSVPKPLNVPTVKTPELQRQLGLDPGSLLDTFGVETGHFVTRPDDF